MVVFLQLPQCLIKLTPGCYVSLQVYRLSFHLQVLATEDQHASFQACTKRFILPVLQLYLLYCWLIPRITCGGRINIYAIGTYFGAITRNKSIQYLYHLSMIVQCG